MYMIYDNILIALCEIIQKTIYKDVKQINILEVITFP